MLSWTLGASILVLALSDHGQVTCLASVPPSMKWRMGYTVASECLSAVYTQQVRVWFSWILGDRLECKESNCFQTKINSEYKQVHLWSRVKYSPQNHKKKLLLSGSQLTCSSPEKFLPLLEERRITMTEQAYCMSGQIQSALYMEFNLHS